MSFIYNSMPYRHYGDKVTKLFRNSTNIPEKKCNKVKRHPIIDVSFVLI